MVAATRPLLWRAGADRMAHAFRHKEARTLCGAPVTPERLAWPTENVCALCQALAVEEVATA